MRLPGTRTRGCTDCTLSYAAGLLPTAAPAPLLSSLYHFSCKDVTVKNGEAFINVALLSVWGVGGIPSGFDHLTVLCLKLGF